MQIEYSRADAKYSNPLDSSVKKRILDFMRAGDCRLSYILSYNKIPSIR